MIGERPAGRRIHVFCGPTISGAEVLELLPDACVHPPVGCRDLGRIQWRPDDVAAIIDGLFLQAPAVRHKEILTLIERGVIVCGASSMGALRAAELRPFGMIGVGVVYRLYSLGVIDRDDEVAIAHTPVSDGCRPLSVAQVAVRVAARGARRDGLIDDAHERRLVAAAAGLPFPARRWKTIVSAATAAGGDPRQCAAFLDYCVRTDPDVKRDDARRLLRELAGGALLRRVSRRPPAHPWTHFQQVWELEGRGEVSHGVFVSDRDALRCLQLVSGDFPTYYRRFCLQRIAADGAGLAPRRLDDIATCDVEDMALDTARARGLIPRVARRALAHFDLAHLAEGPEAGDAVELSRDDLLTLLVRGYRHEPGAVPMAALVDELGRLPTFAAARGLAGRARKYLERLGERDERFRQDHVTASAVATRMVTLWRPAGYHPGAAQDRGFPSLRSVLKAARPLVPYLAAPDAHVPDLRLFPDLPASGRPQVHDQAENT